MAKVPQTKKPDPFDRSFDGVFGMFQTSESFRMYYLLTSVHIDPSSLEMLRVAAEALPLEAIDFEELVQRDVDYERVEDELVGEYLKAGKDRVLFFPPLLVTPLVLEDDNSPLDTYRSFNDKVPVKPENDETPGVYEAVWDENKFKLELPLQATDTGHKIKCAADGKEYHYVHYAATLHYNSKYVKPVVLDGQHRLMALRSIVNGDKGDLFAAADLPLCLFFSPDALHDTNKGQSLIKNMRELFVTINSTSKKVSGHFISLLKDNSLASMSVRALAGSWKNTGDPASNFLHLLEWNQRQDSKANQKTRPYSVTTVSIISDCLAKVFKPQETRILLNLASVKEELETAGGPDIDAICEDLFSAAQVKVLRTQIEKYMVPALACLFSEPTPYQLVWQRYTKAVKWLDDQIAKSIHGAKLFKESVLLQFRSTHRRDPQAVKDIEIDFRKQTDNAKQSDDSFFFLMVFQQGLLRAWARLCQDLVFSFEVTPVDVAKAFVQGLEQVCFSSSKKLFAPSFDYTQHMFYLGAKIRVTETSKDAISTLLIVSLLNPKALEKFTASFGLPRNRADELATKISKVAKVAAESYKDDLNSAFQGAIKKSYRFMAEINDADKRELDELSSDAEAFGTRTAKLAEARRKAAMEVLANVLDLKVDELSPAVAAE